MQNSKIVFHSENESDVLGLKVARCNEDHFEEQQLLSEILEGNYDVCRLKIPSEDEMASLKLYKTGLPFFFSGSIRRYKTFIAQKPEGQFLHPDMTYEIYDGSQDELLKEMLIGTWGTYPLGYYRTPYLCDLVDKEKEIESVFRFYKRNNLNTLNPDNSILFMNNAGKYVGFFALNKINGNLESHIGGILAPYRKDGYFLDMLRYIKNYCIDYQLPHFIFGARNENSYVQKIFQEVGFKAVGSENVFHITSLLSHSKKERKIIRIHSASNTPQELHSLIISQATAYLNSFQKNFRITRVNSLNTTFSSQEELNLIEMSIPLLTNDSFLILVKIADKTQNTIIYYVHGDFT